MMKKEKKKIEEKTIDISPKTPNKKEFTKEEKPIEVSPTTPKGKDIIED